MASRSSHRRSRVALLTLGCGQNVVDSEQIAACLVRAGVQVVHDVRGADVAIINTCGFIDAAKQEAVDLILRVSARGPKAVVVTGCLAQRYGDELRREMPEVDAFVGIDPVGAAQMALRLIGRTVEPFPSDLMLRTTRLTPRAWTYLRIAHGCDNRCAYCAIPLIRGPLRSRPFDELLAEALSLAGQGAAELNVIAQDAANYGVDTEGRRRLHELLRALCRLDGVRWVRVLYLHPAHVYDELLDVMAGEERICPYLDMPLQHANDRVLAAMGRRIKRRQIEQLLRKVRTRLPGVTLRTTFLTGFPGETDAEFEELVEFVRSARFDRVGCFAYSREEGTPAAEMPDQVPERVARERRDHLMAVQQEIAFELAAAREGEVTDVLMEEGEGPGPDLRPARSPREAPDVDPLVLVTGDAPPAGRFARVRIVGALGYDCVAEKV